MIDSFELPSVEMSLRQALAQHCGSDNVFCNLRFDNLRQRFELSGAVQVNGHVIDLDVTCDLMMLLADRSVNSPLILATYLFNRCCERIHTYLQRFPLPRRENETVASYLRRCTARTESAPVRQQLSVFGDDVVVHNLLRRLILGSLEPWLRDGAVSVSPYKVQIVGIEGGLKSYHSFEDPMALMSFLESRRKSKPSRPLAVEEDTRRIEL